MVDRYDGLDRGNQRIRVTARDLGEGPSSVPGFDAYLSRLPKDRAAALFQTQSFGVTRPGQAG